MIRLSSARIGSQLLLYVALLACSACPGNKTPARPAAACSDKACVQVIYDRTSVRGSPRRGLEVDETNIYWSEITGDGSPANTTMKVLAASKLGGGPIRALGEWDDMQAANSLAIDADHLYWLANRKLTRARKDGSSTTELEVPDWQQLDPGPLLDAGDAVLVGGHGCRHVVRVPKDGSPATRWPVSARPVTGGDTGLAVDGPLYYCASGNHVHVLDSRSGKATELVNYRGKAGPVRKVGKDLYWLDAGNPDAKQPSLFMLADGEGAPVALGPAHGTGDSLLYDAKRDTLYWLTGLSNHSCVLGTFAIKEREAGVLVDNLDHYATAAHDDDYVYWGASGAIMRAHK